MRRFIFVILAFFSGLRLMAANDTISIPLTMTVFAHMPQDGPTGSTPDPTDPNQFRASLTGNTLCIHTQEGQVSYVVIQETRSDRMGEDYFFGLSYDTISCPITREGTYLIRIGYWKTDFTGYLHVKRMTLTDINGRLIGNRLSYPSGLPAGYYILRIETTAGTTTKKFYQL